MNGYRQDCIKQMSAIINQLQKWLPRNKLNVFGKDSLINTPLPYFLMTLLFMNYFLRDNPSPFPFIAIAFTIFPLLDQIFSLDERNPTEEESKELLRKDKWFRLALFTAMTMDWANNIKFLRSMQNFQLGWGTSVRFLGMVFVGSLRSTAQIAIAHQVMHKPGWINQFLSKLSMSKIYYRHFAYHHLYRHHRDVATPLDSATARKGETVYSFAIRSVRDSWKAVYHDQRQKGKTFLQNEAVQSILYSIVFATGIYLIFGFQPLVIHSLISCGAIFYLQAINYVEHYGLRRKQLPNGQYEKTTILHSWNAPHRFTNYSIFKLQRHSDHHQNASKPYQLLVTQKESPSLPHGYTVMLLMSFFPKIFMRIMDPLVEQYSHLSVEDGGKIDAQVFETSIRQTRKFIIETALSTMFLVLAWNSNLI